jgi:hypothetical protein
LHLKWVQASSGLIIAGVKPQSPAIRPTPTSVWKAVVVTKSTYAFILHPFLYMFSEDPEKRKILAQLKGVVPLIYGNTAIVLTLPQVFGGGPLRQPIGNQLAKEGANLLTFFGSYVDFIVVLLRNLIRCRLDLREAC